MILGLSGYAQVGKDTLGAALVKNYGFTRFAFADALKEVVYRLDPWVPDVREESDGSERLSSLVDRVGWEKAKTNLEVRRLLQKMGTEAGREVLGQNIWVDTVLNQIGDRDAVITDCRFPNEAQAVKDRGGFVVRVTRPGVEAVNAHPSETSLDGWNFDAVVGNSGALDDVEVLAEFVYESLKTSDTDLHLF